MTTPDELAALSTESRLPGLEGLDLWPTAAIADLMARQNTSVTEAVSARVPAIAAAVDAAAERMRAGGRLVYVGAGTAGRLGVLDASECPPTFGVPPELVVGLIAGGPAAVTGAVEGAEDDTDAAVADLDRLGITAGDTVVGISASGRTPYVVAAVRHAASLGALTIGVSCNAGAPLSEAAGHGVEVVVGPEVVSGSTRLKAGTAQKLVLNMISTILMVRLGRTYGDLMVGVVAVNDKLRVRAARIVAEATGADPEAAGRTLAACGGDVKAAILCLATGVSPDAAAQVLAGVGGNLRAAFAEL
jgi:N-acetylmuramic acid 6-phosphate etherase